MSEKFVKFMQILWKRNQIENNYFSFVKYCLIGLTISNIVSNIVKYHFYGYVWELVGRHQYYESVTNTSTANELQKYSCDM